MGYTPTHHGEQDHPTGWRPIPANSDQYSAVYPEGNAVDWEKVGMQTYIKTPSTDQVQDGALDRSIEQVGFDGPVDGIQR